MVNRRRRWRLKTLPMRSFHNLRMPVVIVLRRLARRTPSYPRLPWRMWAIVCLALALASFFLLDPATGRHHDKWPAALAWFADMSTKLGLGKWYLVPSLVMLVFANLVDWQALSRRLLMLLYNWTSLAFFVLGAAGISGATVLLLKNVVGRARPLNFETMGDFSFYPLSFDARFASFPSGHATVVGSVAAILVLLCPRGRYIVLAAAAWVASTRVFVGAHYPSDTIVGFGLGFGCAVGLAVLFARLGFIFVQRPAGLPVRRGTFRLLPRRHAPGKQARSAPLREKTLADMP